MKTIQPAPWDTNYSFYILLMQSEGPGDVDLKNNISYNSSSGKAVHVFYIFFLNIPSPLFVNEAFGYYGPVVLKG